MKGTLQLLFLLMVGTTLFAQQNDGRFRFSLNAGFAYRIGEISDDTPAAYKEHLEGLKSGFNFEAHAGYFFYTNYGVGIHFSNFSSENSSSFQDEVSIFGAAAFETSDKINISFIAPEFLYRSTSNNERHTMITSISVGYLAYKDELTVNGVSAEVTGGNVGFGLGLAYDYHITPNIAIGANVGFLAGTLSKIEFSANGQTDERTLEDDERENLTRINLSAGVRFYL